MELRHLRHFLAVADALSYSRAAEALHMAASPLSRSIQQLEHGLGGPLFDRGTRRVELTPPGAGLVPRARKLLDEVDDEILRGRMALGLVTRRVHERRLEYLEVMQEASAIALPDREPFRALAGAGVVIRPLPAAMPRAITHLAWRTDRAAPDDLGPIIALARERFAILLMC
jgi:DNA-binding transcriptional LysR family regulator